MEIIKYSSDKWRELAKNIMSKAEASSSSWTAKIMVPQPLPTTEGKGSRLWRLYRVTVKQKPSDPEVLLDKNM